MKYTSKVDLVYKSIVNGIKKGDYLPGDRIVISRVARENGCSEIPVREALRRLESEKLVELLPNRGAVVSRVSKSFLEQLFAVKAILEGGAVRLAADSITPASLKRLRTLAADMVAAYEAGNLKQCSALNHKFHITLYRTTGNDVLVSYIDELWNKWPTGHYANAIPDDWYKVSMQQHFELLDALEAGDKDKAEEIIRYHKWGALESMGRRSENARGIAE